MEIDPPLPHSVRSAMSIETRAAGPHSVRSEGFIEDKHLTTLGWAMCSSALYKHFTPLG
jgi:hypothetical protein